MKKYKELYLSGYSKEYVASFIGSNLRGLEILQVRQGNKSQRMKGVTIVYKCLKSIENKITPEYVETLLRGGIDKYGYPSEEW